MQQRIAVLGSGDVIGREIASTLAREGAEILNLDAVGASGLAAALAEVDGVVDASGGAPAGIEASARTLYAAVATLGRQPRVVQLGSQTVYGAATGTVDERAPLRAELGAYAAARIAAEASARAYPNAVTLRCGVEYGRGHPVWNGRIARLLLDGRLGALGPAGEGICNLVHVDDVVAATLAALRTPGIGGEIYNLAMPFAPTWNGYLAAFAEALGALPLRRISGLRLKFEALVLAPPLKIAEKLGIASAPLIPPSMLRSFRHALRLDSTKIERQLGLRWTPLAEGLAEAAAPYRNRAGH